MVVNRDDVQAVVPNRPASRAGSLVQDASGAGAALPPLAAGVAVDGRGIGIAIMDSGRIIALDTPEALKASVGKDRVQIRTDDDPAAIAALAEHFGVEARVAEGMVTFPVEQGEAFVPRLFAELPMPIRSVNVSRPTLDDVFMSYTGSTIRDAETTATQRGRDQMQMFRAGTRGGRR